LGPMLVLAHHVSITSGGTVAWETLMLLGAPAAIGLVVMRIWRVAGIIGRETAGDGSLIGPIPPTCEGCGYDLSHHSLDERCPECALAVADSLSPRRRPGCAWEPRRAEAAGRVNPGLADWVAASLEVLLKPGAFYA